MSELRSRDRSRWRVGWMRRRRRLCRGEPRLQPRQESFTLHLQCLTLFRGSSAPRRRQRARKVAPRGAAARGPWPRREGGGTSAGGGRSPAARRRPRRPGGATTRWPTRARPRARELGVRARPQQQLVQRDPDRAGLPAGAAQRGGVRELGRLRRVLQQRRDDRADRPRVDAAVGVPADLALDRAGVQAGAAADAVQRLLARAAEDGERPLSTITRCSSSGPSGSSRGAGR